MKKVIILLISMSILMLQSAYPQANSTPVKTNGRLSVQDGRIVNEHGKPPQLRGISLS